MISESCFSLHESSHVAENVNVVYQTQRSLGRGVDLFDARGQPQTPSVSAFGGALPSQPLELLDSTTSAFAGAASSRHPLVLVRCGVSFQGAHIVVRLLQDGYHVRVLARECPAQEIQNFMGVVQRNFPACTNGRLLVFRGDDLSDAITNCEYIVWNTDPPLQDATTSKDILRRHLDDVQELFLSSEFCF